VPVFSFITTPSQLYYSVVKFILNDRKQQIDLKCPNSNWKTVKHEFLRVLYFVPCFVTNT